MEILAARSASTENLHGKWSNERGTSAAQLKEQRIGPTNNEGGP